MPGGSRRRSRIVAFQTLFEAEASGRDVETTLDRHLEEARLTEDATEFAHHLVDGVQEHRAAIDDIIRERAPAFPLEEMAEIGRAHV